MNLDKWYQNLIPMYTWESRNQLAKVVPIQLDIQASPVISGLSQREEIHLVINKKMCYI